MRIFVTGATGFIGSALVPDLIGHGHKVLGLSRTDAGAAALKAQGAEVHRGSLEDLDSLRSGVAAADGVIHLAFNHDFSKFVENSETDRRVIEALGAALAGSERHMVVTSGTAAAFTPGRPSTEDDPSNSPIPRKSEQVASSLSERGIAVSVMRLSQVHDPVKQGLISPLIEIAREKGVSAYVGDGRNRWPAVHLSDAAPLFRLALEKGVAGARYNAVAEEGVPLRDIAEAIGRGLKVPVVSKSPEEAGEHFGWLGMFAGADIPASSALTRERLGWHPTGPGLLSDLERMQYGGS